MSYHSFLGIAATFVLAIRWSYLVLESRASSSVGRGIRRALATSTDSSFVLSARLSASCDTSRRGGEISQRGWMLSSNLLKILPSAHIPFSISSITRLDRWVTTYSAASNSCSSVDRPSSSFENCRAEPSEIFSACLTSRGLYSVRSTKRLTYC